MQKVETQRSQVPQQAALRQGGGAAFESPQSDQITQLEAMVEASPQVAGLARFAAMANGSPQAAAQRRIMDMIGNSPRMAVQRKAAEATHNSPNIAAQRQQLDTLSGEIAQREEAEEPLQPKVAQRAEAASKPNNTGLPDKLKSGIESLSGMSMDSVRVHYNSSQPAQLNALAYAQGTDIHVAPGQEQHLPHEAWHVVQQAQGRVRPTMQMKGAAINDDAGLEAEADAMGGRAVSGVVQGKSKESGPIDFAPSHFSLGLKKTRYAAFQPIQRSIYKDGETWKSALATGEYKTEDGARAADIAAGGNGDITTSAGSSISSSSSSSSAVPTTAAAANPKSTEPDPVVVKKLKKKDKEKYKKAAKREDYDIDTLWEWTGYNSTLCNAFTFDEDAFASFEACSGLGLSLSDLNKWMRDENSDDPVDSARGLVSYKKAQTQAQVQAEQRGEKKGNAVRWNTLNHIEAYWISTGKTVEYSKSGGAMALLKGLVFEGVAAHISLPPSAADGRPFTEGHLKLEGNGGRGLLNQYFFSMGENGKAEKLANSKVHATKNPGNWGSLGNDVWGTVRRTVEFLATGDLSKK